MSATENKLNTSLDDILKNERAGRRGRGAGRRNTTGRRSTGAPVGGVSKPTRQTKQPVKAAPAIPTGPAGGDHKIMISNLPQDVEETQLKEYFATAVQVGRPKKVTVQYGANGRSLGTATVTFSRQDQAAKATAALQGVKIDTRPIRVEMLVSAANVAASTGRANNLADRVTQPKKDKPKPATETKGAPAGGRATRGRAARGREARGGGRGGREGRERTKKKTVEELDAEMDDYFPAGEGSNDAMVSNGGAAPAAGGDTNMDDEML
ncbi:RNA-binding domain-containing protein [Massarina eburnea CBS 473.64]|uniref:RNA-binding domain-containing protein n=1 Tax=Massarina eburnea CBS 473.64 TaxID=1395130 RepID=A0A6A6RRF9_9PLEO|nr:RNA-binding domain-containing protein [Massarina eburnea CBS 473.64]